MITYQEALADLEKLKKLIAYIDMRSINLPVECPRCEKLAWLDVLENGHNFYCNHCGWIDTYSENINNFSEGIRHFSFRPDAFKIQTRRDRIIFRTRMSLKWISRLCAFIKPSSHQKR